MNMELALIWWKLTGFQDFVTNIFFFLQFGTLLEFQIAINDIFHLSFKIYTDGDFEILMHLIIF